MCPICLVNLRKSANGTIRIRDISEYLIDAVAAEPSNKPLPAQPVGRRGPARHIVAGKRR